MDRTDKALLKINNGNFHKIDTFMQEYTIVFFYISPTFLSLQRWVNTSNPQQPFYDLVPNIQYVQLSGWCAEHKSMIVFYVFHARERYGELYWHKQSPAIIPLFVAEDTPIYRAVMKMCWMWYFLLPSLTQILTISLYCGPHNMILHTVT